MIKGLHTCKPKNVPKVGQVKRFTVLDMGNWTKIKNVPPDQDGQNYKITECSQTDWVDNSGRGNVSFNIVIEPTDEQPAQTSPAPQQSAYKPTGGVGMSNDDYWERKEDRDRERDARDVAKQPRIERQHAQEMALRLATINNRLILEGGTDGDPKIDLKKLKWFIDWFQKDCGGTPTAYQPDQPEEKTEPY